jgi:hypothetical protein
MNKLLIGADILMAAIFAWRFQYMPDQIPLLYSRPWGDPQLVEYWYIALLPILMHIFYFFNAFIIKKFFHSEELFQQLFNILNIFVIIAFTGIFLKIIFLVT